MLGLQRLHSATDSAVFGENLKFSLSTPALQLYCDRDSESDVGTSTSSASEISQAESLRLVSTAKSEMRIAPTPVRGGCRRHVEGHLGQRPVNHPVARRAGISLSDSAESAAANIAGLWQPLYRLLLTYGIGHGTVIAHAASPITAAAARLCFPCLFSWSARDRTGLSLRLGPGLSLADDGDLAKRTFKEVPSPSVSHDSL